MGPDGNFYGTTYGSSDPYGGLNLWGTVFEVTSNGIFTTLASFVGTNGENSKASLTLGPDGNFYGTTSYGGADEIGEIYRLDLPPEIIQQPASQGATEGGSSLYPSRFLAQRLIPSSGCPITFQFPGQPNIALTIPTLAPATRPIIRLSSAMPGAVSPAPWHRSRLQAGR